MAVMTGLPARLHFWIISFCARKIFSVGISMPRSPRATCEGGRVREAALAGQGQGEERQHDQVGRGAGAAAWGNTYGVMRVRTMMASLLSRISSS